MTSTLTRPAAEAPAGERESFSLDGPWLFRMEGEEAWREAMVPAPWQALFGDLRHGTGTGIYRRRVEVPSGWGERNAFLCFGAVSDRADVLLDGRLVGTHEGGYLPFEFDLGELAGVHEIEVRAMLPSGEVDRYPDGPFAEIPHGKQSWYGPLGGIWQSVRLEARSAQHVVHCAISPDLKTGRVLATIRLAGSPRGKLRATVLAPGGAAVAEAEQSLSGEAVVEVELHVADPAAWSPDHPNLYGLRLELVTESRLVDRWNGTFGFRTIEARDGRLFLNDKPLYLRGALDQDYYPDGISTPPSLEFLEDQLLKAKRLGLNCLRIHIKVPDPRYHEAADRLGMLVWAELPNVEHLTPQAARRAKETLAGILERDGNHPSIVAWTIINEDWGTQLPEDESHRFWLAEMVDWLKALDPTRLVVDNSPCQPNFHVKTDINDYHYYRCLPERRQEWDRLTAEFAAAAPWTFSPHGDAQQTGKEPLVVSEFGVWGLPDLGKLTNEDGSEPWWMETGQSWGDGAAYPHGMRQRFDMLRLERVFGSYESFVAATQWHQFRNLKYQIESIRAHSSISGYVLTEFTDVHWEANGLLDMRRNPRVFHERFAEVNADIVVVPKVERWAFWSGEQIAVEPVVAAGIAGLPDGAVLEWAVQGLPLSGRSRVPAAAPLAVVPAEPIRLAAPGGTRPALLTFAFTLKDAAGAVLAVSSLEISVYPRVEAGAGPMVFSPHPDLSERFQALGYRASARPEEAEVVILRSLDADEVEAIRKGRRVLLLAGDDPQQRLLRRDEPPPQPPHLPEGAEKARRKTGTGPGDMDRRYPTLGLAERNGTIWRGDWIASFGWLRRHGAFAAFPGGPLLDLSFDGVVPHHVLTGFRPWEYEARVHAGVVVGWAHKPAALVGERPFGAGKMVASTFRLCTADPGADPGADPVASHLADALLRTAAGAA